MLRKFLLISVFALCATLYAYGPEWSSVNAQGTLPTAQPIPEGFANDFSGVTDPDIQETSEDIALSPTDGSDGSTAGPATVGIDPDTGNTIATFPVGFTNTSDGPLDNVILTTPLGDGQSLPADSPWEEITLPDDTRVAAYNAGTLVSGEGVEIPISIVDNNIDAGAPAQLPVRLDAEQEDGTAISLAGVVNHTPSAEAPGAVELPGNFDDILPDTTEDAFAIPDNPTTDLQLSPTDGTAGSVTTPATVSQDPDTGETTVNLPVGFTNNSAGTLSDVILTVPLAEGETLPEDSLWTEITLPDNTRVAAFNLGSLAAGNSAEIPFIFNSNNVAAGDTVQLPTRLDATDADGNAIALAGVVEQTPLAPTALDTIDEPVQDILLFLPIISR